MVPLIVQTIPENQSQTVALDTIIRVQFADLLDPLCTTDWDDTVSWDENQEFLNTEGSPRIYLTNVTQNRPVPYVMDWNTESLEMTITPADDADGNRLLGLCEYRLSFLNLYSPNGEYMTGKQTLFFKTISDVFPGIPGIEDNPDPPVVTRWYPKSEAAGVTPATIKVLFDREIDADSVTEETFFVTLEWIDDIDDIGFLEYEPIDGEVSVTARTITWTPADELPANERCTIVVNGILEKDSDSNACLVQVSSFFTEFDPCDITLRELKSNFSAYNSIAQGVTEYDIYSMIRSNSEYARYLDSTVAASVISWADPPKYALQYVIDKTRYDLVLNRYVGMTGEATRKQLADLAVDYTKDMAGLLNLLKLLKAAYEKWEAQILGKTSTYTSMAIAIKGSDVDENPDFMNRRFKSFDGTKSWGA